jgi:hypothetical protein
MVSRSYLLATCAVLPLFAPEVWSGFRLGLSDIALSVIAQTEQPLSVRSPGGIWAMGLALTWLTLAYWQRTFALWEAVLVLLGGIAALARVGNMWLDALLMIMPLARRLSESKLPVAIPVAAAVASVVVAIGLGVVVRPPSLPSAANQAAVLSTSQGAVMADWRWSGDLQQRLGRERQVLAAGGLTAESTDFWLDYVRVAQGHERWADILRQRGVNLVVLDAADQQRQAASLIRSASDWRVLYDAAGALVAERTTTP